MREMLTPSRSGVRPGKLIQVSVPTLANVSYCHRVVECWQIYRFRSVYLGICFGLRGRDFEGEQDTAFSHSRYESGCQLIFAHSQIDSDVLVEM